MKKFPIELYELATIPSQKHFLWERAQMNLSALENGRLRTPSFVPFWNSTDQQGDRALTPGVIINTWS